MARALAAYSDSTRTSYPQRSAILAVEAANIAQTRQEPIEPRTRQALLDSLYVLGGTPFPVPRALENVTLLPAAEMMNGAALSPAARWLIGGAEGVTSLWDLDSNTPSEINRTFSGALLDSTTIATDGSRMLTFKRFDSAPVYLWYLDTDGSFKNSNLGEMKVNGALFSDDGRWVVTDVYQSYGLWDLATPALPKRMFLGTVKSYRFSHDQRWFIFCTDDKLVTINLKDKAKLERSTDQCEALDLFAEDTKIVSIHRDGALRIWPVADAAKSVEPAVALRPSTRSLRPQSSTTSIRRLGSPTSWRVCRIIRPSASTNFCRGTGSATASKRSQRSRSSSSFLYGQRTNPRPSPDAYVEPEIIPGDPIPADLGGTPEFHLWFTNGGEWLITEQYVRTYSRGAQPDWSRIIVRRVSHGLIDRSAQTLNAGTVQSTFSTADARWLVALGIDRSIRLWVLGGLATKDPIVLRSYDSDIYSARASSDSRWLVSVHGDKSIHIWNLQEGDPGKGSIVLRGHDSQPQQIGITSNLRWVVSVAGKSVRIWPLGSLQAASAVPILGSYIDDDDALEYDVGNLWGMSSRWRLDSVGGTQAGRCVALAF